MQVFALKLLILSLSIASTVAIHCYDCNSKFENLCSDPFKERDNGLLKLNCDNKPMHANTSDVKASFCRKVYQKGAKFKINLKWKWQIIYKVIVPIVLVNEEVRVIRSCGYISDTEKHGGCRKSVPSKGVEILSCECFGDLCNGSYKAQTNLLPIAIIIAIFMFFRNYLM